MANQFFGDVSNCPGFIDVNAGESVRFDLSAWLLSSLVLLLSVTKQTKLLEFEFQIS